MMMGGSAFSGRSSSREVDGDTFGRVYDKRVIMRLMPYVRPYRLFAILAFASMLVYVGSQVAIPKLLQVGIDDYIKEGDFRGLLVVGGAFILVALGGMAANFFQQLFMARVGLGMLYDLRRAMFAHLQKLSLSYYDKTEVGRIMSRVQGDVWQLQELMTVVIMTAADLLSLGGIVVMLLILNLKLGLITMAVLPILALAMAIWQPFAVKAFLRIRTAISIVNGALNENITGVRVVQALNRQPSNLKQFDEKNTEHLKANLVGGQAVVQPSAGGGHSDGAGYRAGDILRVEHGAGQRNRYRGAYRVHHVHTEVLRSDTQPDDAVHAAAAVDGFGRADIRAAGCGAGPCG